MDYFVKREEHNFLGFGPYYRVTNLNSEVFFINADKELCERFAAQLNEEQKKIPFIAYVYHSDYTDSGIVFLGGVSIYEVSSYKKEHIYETITEYANEKKREVIFKEIK